MAGEGAQQRASLKNADESNGLLDALVNVLRNHWPTDSFGSPMLMVSVAQSELIPTAQYANVTLGPVQIVGFIPDGPDEQVKEGMKRFRQLVDGSIAEDRQTLYTELQQRAAAGQSAMAR